MMMKIKVAFLFLIMINVLLLIGCTEEKNSQEEHERYILVVKGTVFANAGDYSKAIEYYDKAIALDPNLEVAWNYKGIALYELGKYSEAIESYDKAISIAPIILKHGTTKAMYYTSSSNMLKLWKATTKLFQ